MATAVAAGLLITRGPPPSKDYFTAAYDGDTEQFMRHIAWGADIDEAHPVEDMYGFTIARTPLLEACDADNDKMIEFLHRHGVKEYGFRWTRNRNWIILLPDSLRPQGARKPGYDRFLWRRPEALQVAQWLSDREIVILSVAVCQRYEGRTFYDLPGNHSTCSAERRSPREPWKKFMARANARAADFIRSFAWREGDNTYRDQEPYFALLVVSRREYESPLPDDEWAK